MSNAELERSQRAFDKSADQDARDAALSVQPGDVIHQLQQELIAAQVRREQEGLLPLFEVEGLEIEMHVAISLQRRRGGKVDIRLIAVTGDMAVDEHRTHTIRLKLKAVQDTDPQGTSGKARGIRPSTRKGRPPSEKNV